MKKPGDVPGFFALQLRDEVATAVVAEREVAAASAEAAADFAVPASASAPASAGSVVAPEG
jgi:hypothetical protein